MATRYGLAANERIHNILVDDVVFSVENELLTPEYYLIRSNAKTYYKVQIAEIAERSVEVEASITTRRRSSHPSTAAESAQRPALEVVTAEIARTNLAGVTTQTTTTTTTVTAATADEPQIVAGQAMSQQKKPMFPEDLQSPRPPYVMSPEEFKEQLKAQVQAQTHAQLPEEPSSESAPIPVVPSKESQEAAATTQPESSLTPISG